MPHRNSASRSARSVPVTVDPLEISTTFSLPRSGPTSMRTRILSGAFAVAGQSAEMGALPTLMAATADLPGGTYVGPDGFAEMHGMPHVVTPRKLARDPEAARRLWEISEEATGVRYP